MRSDEMVQLLLERRLSQANFESMFAEIDERVRRSPHGLTDVEIVRFQLGEQRKKKLILESIGAEKLDAYLTERDRALFAVILGWSS